MHSDSFYKEVFLGILLIFICGLYLSLRQYFKNKKNYEENLNKVANVVIFQDFDIYYSKYINPLNILFEQKRLVYLNKIKVRALILLCFMILNVILFFAVDSQQIILNEVIDKNVRSIIKSEIQWYPFVFLGFVLLIYWVVRPGSSYNAELKNTVYPKIFEFFRGVIYRYKGKFRAKDFSKFVIVPDTCRQICKHEINGSYNDIPFYVSWCKLIDCFSYAMNILTPSYNWPQFQGLLITLDLKDKFNGTTVVKRFGTSVMGLERTNIPDSKFSDKFVVFSNDYNEAVRLVTNTFLQNLQEIGKSFSGTYIEASFFDQQLLLKIGLTSDFFKDNDLSGCNLWLDSEKILQQMQLIHAAIDRLTKG